MKPVVANIVRYLMGRKMAPPRHFRVFGDTFSTSDHSEQSYVCFYQGSDWLAQAPSYWSINTVYAWMARCVGQRFLFKALDNLLLFIATGLALPSRQTRDGRSTRTCYVALGLSSTR